MITNSEGLCLPKVQEFTTKSAKGGLEADHAKNEVKRLKEVIAEGRNKNGDLEYKVLALILFLEIIN